MPLRLFNTLSGRLEEFQPLEGNIVRMYSCGPTVYDYGHIGNFRTFLFVDLLRRHLRQSGYKLRHVMNITDVDDKIIRNAASQHVTVRQYAEKFEKAFFEDCQILNLEKPELLVRATDHIKDMAEFIAGLERKGFAYRTDDGSYYFRIAKFPGYGKLSKKDFAGMTDGARVDVDEYEKDNARDFALWKAPKPGEAWWETPIGKGRPGWHIECSVMAMKYLGETFDIHMGGEDLIFPHHENEIAQSEALTGKPFARYWVHVRFLLVEGEKMSKKLHNFYTLRDLIVKGHKPSSIRYLLASVPYRRQLNFTFKEMKGAAHSVERLRNFKLRLETSRFEAGSGGQFASTTRGNTEVKTVSELARATVTRMQEALDDDLNTAEALAAVFDLVREANLAADAGQIKQADVPLLLEALNKFDSIFDVLTDRDAEKVREVNEWARREGQQVSTADSDHKLSDEQIQDLIAERNSARQNRDFARSDAIRHQLAEAGVIVEDTKDGVRWKRK
jgi:cysteinyl-tRNA synthetase